MRLLNENARVIFKNPQKKIGKLQLLSCFADTVEGRHGLHFIDKIFHRQGKCSLSMKCFSVKFPIYEMSYLRNVLFTKCPVYKMSYL